MDRSGLIEFVGSVRKRDAVEAAVESVDGMVEVLAVLGFFLPPKHLNCLDPATARARGEQPQAEREHVTLGLVPKQQLEACDITAGCSNATPASETALLCAGREEGAICRTRLPQHLLSLVQTLPCLQPSNIATPRPRPADALPSPSIDESGSLVAALLAQSPCCHH